MARQGKRRLLQGAADKGHVSAASELQDRLQLSDRRSNSVRNQLETRQRDRTANEDCTDTALSAMPTLLRRYGQSRPEQRRFLNAIASTDTRVAEVERNLGEVRLAESSREQGQDAEDVRDTVQQLEEEQAALDCSRALLETLLLKA
jgi:hypothetical protein